MDGNDKKFRKSVGLFQLACLLHLVLCVSVLSLRTWKNAQLGDVMISQLEQESRKMADQQEKVKGMSKQLPFLIANDSDDCQRIEQLQTEASALAEEKGKKEVSHMR